MNLPRLISISGLPFSLPPLPEYQVWAINQDTSPPSLVIVEFPYSKPVDTVPSINTFNLLNTTLEQTSTLLNIQLQTLDNRLTTIEGQLSNIPLASS
ncbi:hypothetical protein EBU95_19310 [bacterium]|jgi:hypothetical protein|nr:hypothetical protein [bacterium]